MRGGRLSAGAVHPTPCHHAVPPRRAQPALTSQTMMVLWPIWAAACSGVMPSWARAWGSAPQSCTRYWVTSRCPSWQARYSGVAPVLVWALSVLQAGHSVHHPQPPPPAQGTGGLQGGVWAQGMCRGHVGTHKGQAGDTHGTHGDTQGSARTRQRGQCGLGAAHPTAPRWVPTLRREVTKLISCSR